MFDFNDRVAVITGGASGIGLGLASKLADEGMKIVLADIESAALERASNLFVPRGLMCWESNAMFQMKPKLGSGNNGL